MSSNAPATASPSSSPSRARVVTLATVAITSLSLASIYIYRRWFRSHGILPSALSSQLSLPREYRRINITLTPSDNLNDPSFRQHIWDVCCLYYVSIDTTLYSQIVPTSFHIIQVEGGITNQLYHCQYHSHSILIRIYGPRSELIIDRKRENAVVDYLSQNEWSGFIAGRFLNGRLEQWLDGYHSLSSTPAEMARPPLQSLIAHELATMHQLDPASSTYMPLDVDPSTFTPIPMSIIVPRTITVWRTIFGWLERAREITFDDEKRIHQLKQLNLEWWAQELHTYYQLMQQSPIFADTNTSVLVFAHNDLLSGNVLYHAEQKRVRFIDFEYGAYNPRGFDLANHFIECCGFDCDWAQFPTPTQQSNFARSYLAAINHTTESSITDTQTDALVLEIHGWLLADHFFWGIWAIVQAKYSTINFDYLSYSLRRCYGYKMMKSQSLKCIQQTIPK